MSQWSELPCEVVLSIAKYLLRLGSRELSLVCKSWNRAVAPYILSEITLLSTESLISFKNTFKPSCTGQAVKSIRLHVNEIEAATHIEELARFCPNIRKLSHFPLTSSMPSQIWISFRQFKNLQILPIPVEENWQDYNNCAQLYRNLLIEYYVFGIQLFGEGENLKTHEIQKFTRLQKLNVVKFEKTAKLVDFDKMIDLYPTLMSLTVDVNLTTLTVFEELLLPTQTINLFSIVPQYNMRELRVFIAYDKHVFEYVMHKFPLLQHLRIKFIYPNILAIQSGLIIWDKDDFKKFHGYTLRLLDYTVQFFYPIESLPKLLKYRKEKKLTVEVRNWETTVEENHELASVWFGKTETEIVNRRQCTSSEMIGVWWGVENIEVLVIRYHLLDDPYDLQMMTMHALSACRRIKFFEYTAYSTLVYISECPDSAMFNPFLEEIELCVNDIGKSVYLYYSKWFPSLKRMKVNLLEKHLEEGCDEHTVYMPHTFFDHLSLSFEYVIEGHHTLLKINTNSNRKTYLLHKRNQCLEIEKQTTLVKITTHVITIYCHSIHCLSLKYKHSVLDKYVLDL